MPHDPLISALGTVVRIDASALAQSDRDALRAAWADALAPDDAEADGGVVIAPGDMERERMLSLVSQRVTHAAIAARRGQLWMLHAGAIADEQGRTVVVIGPSGRGKTTSVRALSKRYAYVTDETVAIDADGVVHPYRKPLSIIEEAGRPKAQRSPRELGLGALPGALLRVAALVLLDRRADGPDAPVIEPCDLGDVLGEVTEQTSHLSDLPSALRMLHAHAAAVGGIRRVVYREAETLADALAPLFRDADQIVVPAAPLPVDDADAGGWRRADYIDALALHDPARLALLQTGGHGGGMLRVLDGIGPTLWSFADGRSREEMLAAVVAVHGEPASSNAAALVDDALAALAAQGVVHDGVVTSGHDM